LKGPIAVESKRAQEVFSLIEANLTSGPSSEEFQMACQVRVALDRIRFTVKQLEQIGVIANSVREVSLQLLNALERLESADRWFQSRSRQANEPVEQWGVSARSDHLNPFDSREDTRAALA
jgi:hypothetical protein